MDDASFITLRAEPRSTLFPDTTLFRSGDKEIGRDPHAGSDYQRGRDPAIVPMRNDGGVSASLVVRTERKSTRLNSSHVRSSYAVFCLKKKKSRRTDCLGRACSRTTWAR